MSLDKEEFQNRKKDAILTNPLPPRRHIEIFLTSPLPDVAINKTENCQEYACLRYISIH